MSKEFQIRDGNLIASFDLENEDGDIDFCKLLKVSHGVADEIGIFVDYVATNKIIKDQSKQISDLETKLAEKDKTIDEINKEFLSAIKDWKQLVEIEKSEKAQLKQQLTEKEKEIEEYVKINDVLHSGLSERCDKCEEEHDQDKISFCIEQLEALRGNILCNEVFFDRGVNKLVDNEIDDMIKRLKEGKIK